MKIRIVAESAFAAIGLMVLITACEGSRETSALYFNQTPPGETPVVFAPGVISKPDRFEQFLLYSPDGQGLTFGVTNNDWSEFSLQYMQRTDDGWSDAVSAPFLGDNPDAFTSCISYDGAKVFFTTARPSYPPADIWENEFHDGQWSKPKKLPPPISSSADEFEVHISKTGTLYFSSARDGGLGDLDIYKAPLVDDEYPEVENLGPSINTSSGDDIPITAPDESFLIFASDRPGGFGYRDLYVSFRINDVWSAAQNLGPGINSAYWEIYPTMSPDGKYLFFTRRQGWQATEDTDIYWVSADIIEDMRNALRAK